MRAARAASLVAVIAAAGALAWTVADHARLREEWGRMRDRLHGDGYDAAESDRRYDAAEAARTRVRWSALALGVGGALTLVLAGAARGTGGVGAEVAARRLRLATWLDGLVLAAGASAVVGLGTAVGPAWSEVVASALGPAVLASIAAPLAAGGTPGMRALGIRVQHPTGAGRAIAAALLLPIAVLLALTPLRSRRVAATHLRWIGARTCDPRGR